MNKKRKISVWKVLLVGVPLFIMAAIPLGTIGYNTVSIARQWYAYTRYVPVEVTMLSKGVAQVPMSKNSYRPVVRYGYHVDGRAYEGNRVTPLGYAASEGTAWGMLDGTREGSVTTGYYDPRDPSRSYVVRIFRFSPYALTAGPTLALLLVALPILYTGRGHDVIEPVPHGEGWYAVPPSGRLASRLRVAGWLTAAYAVVAGTLYGHYFAVAPRPASQTAVVTAWLALAGGLLPAYFFWRSWRVAKKVGDARLLIDAPATAPGRTVRFRMEQPVRGGHRVEETGVALFCDRWKRSGKNAVASVEHQQWVRGEPRVVDGEAVFQGALTVPPEGQPTSPVSANPRYVWHVDVVTTAGPGPRYRETFPIQVDAAPAVPATAAVTGP